MQEFGNVTINRNYIKLKVEFDPVVRELCAPVKNVIVLLVQRELEDLARSFRNDDGTLRAMTLTVVEE